jgi:hypothetical protein
MLFLSCCCRYPWSCQAFRSSCSYTRERLSKLIEECETDDTLNPAIPYHMTWTVTMWHFGADVLVTYEGEKIYTSWEVGQHALITAYSKDWRDGKRRIRIEKQEYPKTYLADALEEKLSANSSVVEEGVE